MVVGCGRVVARRSGGRLPVSGCVAVVVRCGMLPLSVGGPGLPWSALDASSGGALVESGLGCSAGEYRRANRLVARSCRGLSGSALDLAGHPVALAVSCGCGWVRMDALDKPGYRYRQGIMLGLDLPGRLGVSELDQAGAVTFWAACATAALSYASDSGGGTGG